MAKRKAKKEPDTPLVLLQVTTSAIYAFKEGEINGWTVEQVVQDWFKNHSLNGYHASRDSSRVGNSTLFVRAKRLTVDEFGKRVRKAQQMKPTVFGTKLNEVLAEAGVTAEAEV